MGVLVAERPGLDKLGNQLGGFNGRGWRTDDELNAPGGRQAVVRHTNGRSRLGAVLRVYRYAVDADDLNVLRRAIKDHLQVEDGVR